MKHLTEGEKLAADGMEPLEIARHFARQQFPGINEAEAMAYVRGIAKGLAMAGMKDKAAMRLLMEMEGYRDDLLGAGNAFTGINLIESMVKEKQ